MINYNILKEKPLSIVGHYYCDDDCVISCVLLKKVLKKNGIHAVIKRRDDIHTNISQPELKKIFNSWPILDKNTDETNWFLVKHSDKDERVVGCIDRKDKKTKDLERIPNFYYQTGYSIAKIIYDIFGRNFSFTSKDIYYIVLACLINTRSLNEFSAFERDNEWMRNSIKKYNLPYQELYKKGLCLTDLEAGVSTVINSRRKFMRIDGFKAEISQIVIEDLQYLYQFIDTDNYMAYCVKHIQEVMCVENIYIWILFVTDIKTKTQSIYYINRRSVKKEHVDGFTLPFLAVVKCKEDFKKNMEERGRVKKTVLIKNSPLVANVKPKTIVSFS